MTSNLDNILHKLGEDAAQPLSSNFANGLWSRIGEIQERKSALRSNALAMVMFVVAVGAGVGAAEKPALAQSSATNLADGPDYSPAALLHVSQ